MTRPAPSDVLERVRREVERNALRARHGIRYIGGRDFAPRDPTPNDVVWQQGKVELKRYRNDNITHSPPVLIILGLISRPTLFDLHENASMVRSLRDAGFDPYVLDWGIADAGDADNTLETYIDRYLPRAVRALLRVSNAEQFTFAGYCMGGNMALMAVAGRPELPVRNLVTMATCVDFRELYPQVDPVRDPSVSAFDFVDETGCIPGEIPAQFFKVRKPTANLVQYVNLWENLWNSDYVEAHQAIARWVSDHVPLPQGAAEQMLGWLRENPFMTNELTLGGQRIDLSSITIPTLSILTLKDEIVPPASGRPIADLIGSEDFTLLELDAGHVGLAIGRSAHKVMYPRLVNWLQQHGEPSHE